MLAQGLTGVRHYGEHGERRLDDLSVFVQSFAPPPRMLVFGAIDFAAAVARAGKFLGYRVTVCDARPIFATNARFPDADEVVVDWPHRYLAQTPIDSRTVICVLTHDPKFDVPVLEVALRTPAGYIGAMGSRRTHDDRLARLREAGLTEDELARLRSPIGLDLGARTPEETAVSVAAELIQLRWGGSGQPLTATTGRIHHRAQLTQQPGRPRSPAAPSRLPLPAVAAPSLGVAGFPSFGRAGRPGLPCRTGQRRGDHESRGCGARSVWGVRNQIAGVLLAAGEGSRLGGPKALVEVAGTRWSTGGGAAARRRDRPGGGGDGRGGRTAAGRDHRAQPGLAVRHGVLAGGGARARSPTLRGRRDRPGGPAAHRARARSGG